MRFAATGRCGLGAASTPIAVTRWLILAALAVALMAPHHVKAAAGDACSATSKCSSDAPCCSAQGVCGSGIEQCALGCQPLLSNSPTSCLAMPVCQNQNITFAPNSFNDEKSFRPILDYNGDPSLAPFTLDNGKLTSGPEGVLLALTAPSQAKISTTRYFLYGDVELTARHDARAGLVFAFITMSDVKDEIDWEMTTADATDLQTNFFVQAQRPQGADAAVNAPNGFTVSDWHTYGLSWTADGLQWKIDGKTVRSVKASSFSGFPSTPSLIQVSLWAGGNSTNGDGVVQWAGGPIDWESGTYKEQGYYGAELKSMSINCGETGDSGATSWVYTGANGSDGKPAFKSSSDSINTLKNPSKDSNPSSPGSSTATADSDNDKLWDGSGKGGSSSGSSDAGAWFTTRNITHILVPAVAGAIALIALWAAIVACNRRRRKNNRANLSSVNDSTLGNVGTKASNALGAATGGLVGGGAAAAARYKALSNDAEDDAPMGAQRQGNGYGPAAGPSPGGRGIRWDDQSPPSTAGLGAAGGYNAYRDGSVEMKQAPFSSQPAASARYGNAPPSAQSHHTQYSSAQSAHSGPQGTYRAYSPAPSQYSYRHDGYANGGFTPLQHAASPMGWASPPNTGGSYAGGGYQTPSFGQMQQQQGRQPPAQYGGGYYGY